MCNACERRCPCPSCEQLRLEDTYTTPSGPVATTSLRLDDDGYLS